MVGAGRRNHTGLAAKEKLLGRPEVSGRWCRDCNHVLGLGRVREFGLGLQHWLGRRWQQGLLPGLGWRLRERHLVAPGRGRVAERAHHPPRLVEDRRHVGVAGEHDHLPVWPLLGEELHQHAGRRAGPGVVKVHKRVVHDHRQRHVVTSQIADERQPQRQKHLLPRAAAETLGLPERAVPLVDLEAGLIHGGGD